MQEMRVWSLGWKDPLEWQMATDSSILAWRIPQIEEPSRLQPMGSKESYMTEHSSTTVIVDLQRFVKVLSKVLSYIHMCVCVCVLALVTELSCVWLFVTPWTVACQAPLSIGFSKQKYQSGLPCPPPGNLPNPGIRPGSPALQADSSLSKHPGKPIYIYMYLYIHIFFRFLSLICYYKVYLYLYMSIFPCAVQ